MNAAAASRRETPQSDVHLPPALYVLTVSTASAAAALGGCSAARTGAAGRGAQAT